MAGEAAVGDLRDSLDRLGLKPDQQLALLPESGDEADAAVEQSAERRGRGRPLNAQNRATRQMRNFLLQNFTDPAVGLASSGLCSTLAASVVKARALAQALGCKKIEALDFMRRCSEGTLPYVHSKQPLAVQLNGKVAVLRIGLGGDAADRVGGDALAALLDHMAGSDEVAPLALEDLTEEENATNSAT